MTVEGDHAQMIGKERVAIARRHGLSLSDARALKLLTDGAEEAERLAASYAAPAQLTREDLKTMKPADILKAKDEGRLSDLLDPRPSKPAPPVPVEPAPARPAEVLHSGSVGPEDDNSQLTRDDLRGMKPDAILEARAAGRLNQLLRIKE